MCRGLDKCRYGVYWLLILRDQLVVGSLGLICPVAASGHNYLALIRQGGLNPLTGSYHRKKHLGRLEGNRVVASQFTNAIEKFSNSGHTCGENMKETNSLTNIKSYSS